MTFEEDFPLSRTHLSTPIGPKSPMAMDDEPPFSIPSASAEPTSAEAGAGGGGGALWFKTM